MGKCLRYWVCRNRWGIGDGGREVERVGLRFDGSDLRERERGICSEIEEQIWAKGGEFFFFLMN